jgi:hypothetical protein
VELEGGGRKRKTENQEQESRARHSKTQRTGNCPPTPRLFDDANKGGITAYLIKESDKCKKQVNKELKKGLKITRGERGGGGNPRKPGVGAIPGARGWG